MKELLKKLNKLSLPAVILIASVILGGFYYASQINKRGSIEKQQQNKLLEEERIRNKEALKETYEKLDRQECVSEAEEAAQEQYKKTCTYDCKEGYYYVANYENYYKTCLQRKGLQ